MLLRNLGFYDLIFFSSLVLCIGVGSSYKKLEDPIMKKYYGTGLGLLVTLLICGHRTYHTIFMVLGNVVIIKCCEKQYVHHLSVMSTLLYLLYLYYNVNYTIYMKWLLQVVALRMMGLAFELHHFAESKTTMAGTSKSQDPLSSEPTPLDIFCYAFFFVGLHKGPYYRYKVFDDHFNAPFGVLGDCRIITKEKIRKAIFCSTFFLILKKRYTSKVYYSDHFYKECAADYRFIYNVPQLCMYFLQYQIMMVLCKAVCSETGFGVYPVKCMTMPGYGPTANFDIIKQASEMPEVAVEQTFSFAMLKCFDYKKVLVGPRMRDTMRGWDMPTRYWFWAYMYKSFIKSNKEVRSACSFLAWTIWCGPSLGQCILSLTLWLYVHLEAEYSDLYNTSSAHIKASWDIGFSIMRMLCLIYLTPSICICDSYVVLRYYNSIFWIFHVTVLILMLSSVGIYKSRQFIIRLSRENS